MADQIFIEVTKKELNDFIKKAIENCLKEHGIIDEKANDKLMKIEEVCQLLKVSKVTVHKWKKSGRIPFHRISSRIFFKESEILDSLKRTDLKSGKK